MRRIGQRPSPGVSGQSLPTTLLTTSWRPPLHSPRRRSIAHATLVLSVSFGPVLRSSVTVRQVLVTRSLALARAATPPSTLGHHSIQGSSFHGPLGANSRPHEAIFGLHEAITGPHSGHLHHGHSVPSPGHSGPFTRLLRAFARPLRGHLLVTGHSHCLVSDNHGLVITSR